MDAKLLTDLHSSLAANMSADYEWTPQLNVMMHQAYIMIALVEQLEKLNLQLHEIELTMRNRMEVGVVQS